MFMRRIREYGMSRYIQTNARGFNEGDTKNYMRKMGEALFMSDVQGLRDQLEIGGIYKIRVAVRQCHSETIYQWQKMECTGIFPHLATFVPVEGQHRQTEAFHYADLCIGTLKRRAV